MYVAKLNMKFSKEQSYKPLSHLSVTAPLTRGARQVLIFFRKSSYRRVLLYDRLNISTAVKKTTPLSHLKVTAPLTRGAKQVRPLLATS